MSHIKDKDSFGNFPEKSPDRSSNDCGTSMNSDLRDKFIKGKKDKKSQGYRNEVLNEKVIGKRDNVRVYVFGDYWTLSYRPMDACPDGCYEKSNEHDDSDAEHDKVFHQAVVKKGFLVVSLEDKI